jgi:predicted O-methyltransferase YrrM
MQFLRNVLINLDSGLNQRRWVRREARRIGIAAPTEASALLAAFDAVLRHDYSPQEAEHIAAIETLRRSLLTSMRATRNPDMGGREALQGESCGSDVSRPSRTTIARAALSSKSRFWASVLFKLVRESRPRLCLELGTNLGISAAYLASALRLNGDGQLLTIEGLASRAELARRHLAGLHLTNVRVITGRFDDVLPVILDESGPVDFAFIDGHHDEAATRRYFDAIVSTASRKALIILDDISWSAGMKQAWHAIRCDPRVTLEADLRVLGVCVVEGGGSGA